MNQSSRSKPEQRTVPFRSQQSEAGNSTTDATFPNASQRRNFTRLSEIPPKDTDWLWEYRIPLGEISVVDGDPSTNKSSYTLELASRVSTGRPMPDGSKGVHGGVLLLLAEDSISKTVQRRLAAAGADMDRIGVMNGDVTLSENLAEIQADLYGVRCMPFSS